MCQYKSIRGNNIAMQRGGGYSSELRYRSCKSSEKGDWEAIVVLPVVAVAAKV